MNEVNFSKLEYVAKLENADLLLVNRSGTNYKLKANNITSNDVVEQKIAESKALNETLVNKTKEEIVANLNSKIQEINQNKKEYQELIYNLIAKEKDQTTAAWQEIQESCKQLSKNDKKQEETINTILQKQHEADDIVTQLTDHTKAQLEHVNKHNAEFLSKQEQTEENFKKIENQITNCLESINNHKSETFPLFDNVESLKQEIQELGIAVKNSAEQKHLHSSLENVNKKIQQLEEQSSSIISSSAAVTDYQHSLSSLKNIVTNIEQRVALTEQESHNYSVEVKNKFDALSQSVEQFFTESSQKNLNIENSNSTFHQTIKEEISKLRDSLKQEAKQYTEKYLKLEKQNETTKSQLLKLETLVLEQIELFKNITLNQELKIQDLENANKQINESLNTNNSAHKEQIDNLSTLIQTIQTKLNECISSQKNYVKKADFSVGAIMFWPVNKITNSWLPCEGQLLSKLEYKELFQYLGYEFGGEGDLFALPDTRGHFIRCWSNLGELDPNRKLGSIQNDSIKAHKHSFIQIQEQNASTLEGEPFNFFELTSVSSPQFSEQKLGIGPDFSTKESHKGYLDNNEGPYIAVGENLSSENETRPSNIAFVCCIKIK